MASKLPPRTDKPVKLKDIKLPKLKERFRLCVRLRDSHKTEGYGICITCGARLHYKDANGGHFDHNKNANYFDERNCHFQCIPCNFGGLGEQYRYGLFLIKTYGEGTPEEIKANGKKYRSFGREEKRKMWKEYGDRITYYESSLP